MNLLNNFRLLALFAVVILIGLCACEKDLLPTEDAITNKYYPNSSTKTAFISIATQDIEILTPESFQLAENPLLQELTEIQNAPPDYSRDCCDGGSTDPPPPPPGSGN